MFTELLKVLVFYLVLTLIILVFLSLVHFPLVKAAYQGLNL